ncbi:RimJ/RimL family protein N-acetyltransferase [Arthrobacter stackebrandtii]|uniref:RimJ/RimL family protein N-acetyltransferase n=1 Tax=Arthrobacter stackebrandtii TaxID=272161 RepID=A0ABS4YWQ6_9MICC|nr:GNAT family N-acetyltransferase [Arthrobacter stackebrandtii]MBP2413231.1 RimJ/RimL family protein N-acetyltransferase [Arthrobacter stackebrandtii]PYH01022.1 N-acetyltransferase [Arthrobacter stackebrandtii]
MTDSATSTQTARLLLSRPVPGDLDGMYAICSDPRVWTHFPSLRHTDPAQTAAMLKAFITKWEQDGLGPWIVRALGGETIIGQGGCSIKDGVFWNLGYRFSADVHGRGFATELSLEALRQAQARRPELPVVAYLLEHNVASARVAVKLGFKLILRAPDAGNPDPAAIRLVYADRPLTPAQLAATLT